MAFSAPPAIPNMANMPATSPAPAAPCMPRSVTYWNSPISKRGAISLPGSGSIWPPWPPECVAEHQGRAFARRVALATGLCEAGAVRADPAGGAPHLHQSSVQRFRLHRRRRPRCGWMCRFEEGAACLRAARQRHGFFRIASAARAGRAFQRFDRAGHRHRGGAGTGHRGGAGAAAGRGDAAVFRPAVKAA